MLLKITEKILRENAFEQKTKKPGLNLTLGEAPIGVRTTGPCTLRSRSDIKGFYFSVRQNNLVFFVPVLTPNNNVVS